MPIYAFRKVSTAHVKLGVSVNVEKRLMTLQHAAGAELQMLHQVDSDAPYAVERELHKLYQTRRSRYGEWFEIPEEQEQTLKEHMERLAAESPKALGKGSAPHQDEFAWLREPLAHAFAASLLTPQQLAQLAHVRPAEIHRILYGTVNLTHAKVRKVAQALNIDLLAVTSDSSEIVVAEPGKPSINDMMDRLHKSNRSKRRA